MAGNVWEWVEDCLHDGYRGDPPVDGRAWTLGCREPARVIRGGSFANHQGLATSTARSSDPPGNRNAHSGTRCVRACNDRDGDGHDTCPPGHTLALDALPADCDDQDAATAPDAPELCNGLDDDCDADVDEACTCGGVPCPDHPAPTEEDLAWAA